MRERQGNIAYVSHYAHCMNKRDVVQARLKSQDWCLPGLGCWTLLTNSYPQCFILKWSQCCYSQILSYNSHTFHPPSAILFHGHTLNCVVINHLTFCKFSFKHVTIYSQLSSSFSPILDSNNLWFHRELWSIDPTSFYRPSSPSCPHCISYLT